MSRLLCAVVTGCGLSAYAEEQKPVLPLPMTVVFQHHHEERDQFKKTVLGLKGSVVMAVERESLSYAHSTAKTKTAQIYSC